MKVMISQPMRGLTDEEIREGRKIVREYLENEGYEVIDTIFTEEPPKTSDRAMWYLAKSIEAMSEVDGVVFMKGWEDARGCVAEEYIARKYGKFCKYIV